MGYLIIVLKTKNKLNNKEIIITINGTDNNKKKFNLLKKKFKGNDLDMQQENNG